VDLFVGGLAPLTVFPAIESARQRKERHPLLGIHAALRPLVYQRVTAAVTFYRGTGSYLSLRGAGKPALEVEGNMVDQAHAEAIFFSLFCGISHNRESSMQLDMPDNPIENVNSSVGMLTLDSPWFTASGQMFPLWDVHSRTLYCFDPFLAIRQSGYRTIQGTYIFLFFRPPCPHLYLVGPCNSCWGITPSSKLVSCLH